MNGDSKVQLKAWKALYKYLPGSNEDHDFWWRLTGRHLASLLEAADYPLEKQYEALLFHYRWTVRLRGFDIRDRLTDIPFVQGSLHGPCSWARWSAD